ncbi:hypothetical protein [Flavivirga rizhaonensis]|uniref:Uncharacterized protein n=1 Tax=Flavivirga rizhaonensis TaxID=2559571 RepID=A0A4S1E0I4_9FLAO|nr:hypothetical protein [Flavivirga rizhaonensis]TGV03392.1 hypothetical protein EM932_06885 [Flavivirga rizhaonensis]
MEDLEKKLKESRELSNNKMFRYKELENLLNKGRIDKEGKREMTLLLKEMKELKEEQDHNEVKILKNEVQHIKVKRHELLEMVELSRSLRQQLESLNSQIEIKENQILNLER